MDLNAAMDPAEMDDIVRRVRERAADPARRIDQPSSELWSSVVSQDLAGLLGMTRSVAQDLGRLLRDGPSDDLVARADELERSMTTPVERPLPAPASPDQLATAERRLGFALPLLLRRLYTEVANGGFGPGPGIVGVTGGWTNDQRKSAEDLYEEMAEAVDENPGWVWPAGMLPIVDYGGVYACVDTSHAAARIVEFDFEELDEDGPDGGWSRAFGEVAPSLASWLADWASTPSPAERQAALDAEIEASLTSVPEVTRAYWAAMTPQQRAEHGLPERGWGRALFGDAWGDDPRDGSGEAG